MTNINELADRLASSIVRAARQRGIKLKITPASMRALKDQIADFIEENSEVAA